MVVVRFSIGWYLPTSMTGDTRQKTTIEISVVLMSHAVD
jgi:hypothetical protein